MNGYASARLILHWAQSTFGPVALKPRERAKRFFEEACELVQTEGIAKEELVAIMDRTYGRPVGDTFKEVGAVLVTVYGYCAVKSINPETALEAEVQRVLDKDPEMWRRKHDDKVTAGTAEER